MCGRYVLISKLKEIESHFGAKAEKPFEANYNITPGTEVPIITNDNTKAIILSNFGFTPSFATKRTYIINARSEGDYNKDNRADYSEKKGIIEKPFFKKAIRSQRCIIPANAFIEGSKDKKLDEPYLVHLTGKNRLFAFAGVYDNWLDPNSGSSYSSFAIITCAPNPLLQSINHHRMPVILNDENTADYLSSSTPLNKITDMLTLFPEHEMQAYKVSRDIKNPKNNSKSLLKPIIEWEKDKVVSTNQMNLFDE